MKLTDEMYELARSTNEKCIILNDDYVLLTKQMPVKDEELENYIENINKANESGINIKRILDYKFIDNNPRGYSKGVFLEERAKGNNLGPVIVDVKRDDTKIDEFVSETEKYIEELKKRSMASDEVYEKLVKDYLALPNYGLMVDPKSLNVFFDEKQGFSLIDPIKCTDDTDLNNKLPLQIYTMVLGYGRPKYYIQYDPVNYLPMNYNILIKKYYAKINLKIVEALKKHNISEENIFKGINFFEINFNREVEIKNIDEIERIVIEKQEMLNNKKR